MSNKPLEFRTVIGPQFNTGNPNQKPIPAADGWVGIIILLSYFGGGTNLFPKDINPEFFWMRKDKDGTIHISPEGLMDLGETHFKAIGREVKGLMTSSLKEYALALRKGRRANGSGQFPAVNTTFHRYEDPPRLEIHPRNYQKDEEEGLTQLIPQDIL